MRLLKNKIFIGILCIAVALLIGFVAVPVLSGSQSQISVVRITEPIAAGTQITEKMVKTVSVPDGVVSGDISNVSSVVGKYASTDLYIGDYLTAEKITDTLEETDSFSAGTRKGKVVVSITLPSLASGVSGRLLPGDVVMVMEVSKSELLQAFGVEPTDATDEVAYNSVPSTVIYPELQYVEVCMVTTSQGADALVEANPADDQVNTLPVTVSFYVNQQQALRLAELEREGTIYLAFVARGADAAQYIPNEDRVMNTEVWNNMLISIWGRDGVGKSTLADTLGGLFSKKGIVAVIDTDLTQPTLPMHMNGKEIDPETSMGKAISGIGTGNVETYLHQHPKKKQLFYAGLTDQDEYLTYEIGLEADDKAQVFIEGCREAADTVILDLSGQRVDPFVPCALIHSDKVIVPITLDVQGVCWYNAVKSLLKSMNAQRSVLPVAAMTDRHHDLPVIKKAADIPFAAVLPFVKEFRQDSTMFPLDGTSSASQRYVKQVKKLYAMLEGDGED